LQNGIPVDLRRVFSRGSGDGQTLRSATAFNAISKPLLRDVKKYTRYEKKFVNNKIRFNTTATDVPSVALSLQIGDQLSAIFCPRQYFQIIYSKWRFYKSLSKTDFLNLILISSIERAEYNLFSINLNCTTL